VIGHNAHLEGCVVADRCLIGSGSVTLNRVKVGTGAIVAAACLLPEGFEVPPGALVAGVPAKIKKTGMPGDWVRALGGDVHRIRPRPPGRAPAPGPVTGPVASKAVASRTVAGKAVASRTVAR